MVLGELFTVGTAYFRQQSVFLPFTLPGQALAVSTQYSQITTGGTTWGR